MKNVYLITDDCRLIKLDVKGIVDLAQRNGFTGTKSTKAMEFICNSNKYECGRVVHTGYVDAVVYLWNELKKKPSEHSYCKSEIACIDELLCRCNAHNVKWTLEKIARLYNVFVNHAIAWELLERI